MKSKKIDEAWIRKGKREKILKDREEDGEVIRGDCPGPHGAPEKLNILDFSEARADGVAVALAGPYAKHLHFTHYR